MTLPDRSLNGEISSVAAVTRPAGWWTGNVVKYDTIVELSSAEELKPGMSAEVEVIIARHADVLTIPTAAVLETAEGFACWVQTAAGPQRRSLTLGDSSDMFIVVEDGPRGRRRGRAQSDRFHRGGTDRSGASVGSCGGSRGRNDRILDRGYGRKTTSMSSDSAGLARSEAEGEKHLSSIKYRHDSSHHPKKSPSLGMIRDSERALATAPTHRR